MVLIFLLALPVWVAAGLFFITAGRTKFHKIVGFISVGAAIIIGLMFSSVLQTGNSTKKIDIEQEKVEQSVAISQANGLTKYIIEPLESC